MACSKRSVAATAFPEICFNLLFMIPHAILQELQMPDATCHPVQGGDISRSCRLYTGHSNYFLKINQHHPCTGLFEKEAAGLRMLADAGVLRVPAPLRYGATGTHQYLLLEWLDVRAPAQNSWKLLGSGLAKMHRKPQHFYGLNGNNYLAIWPQDNTPAETWPEFYSTRRVLPLVRELVDMGNLGKKDLVNADNFCRRLPDLFPEEHPALLHGDLWSGNLLFLPDGSPAIFDPAVYYGHREIDIGMTCLFGGFDRIFYEAYHQTYPLHPGWQQRIPYAQLYPLLLHAWLFNGHYTGEVKRILGSFS
ncbi:fructosamine kinase family protein [Niabella sp. CC-SYL272]|uniref:fructosamine kinase family protein n=1 Tax=Niabella agricola TaxID=2891571 RepID=UPI001F1E9B74|nr:fructosamine kinase family protein [Niabella agricola]MCF3108467.1 fructosamine kinase family protein [Niabella agricola]